VPIPFPISCAPSRRRKSRWPDAKAAGRVDQGLRARRRRAPSDSAGCPWERPPCPRPATTHDHPMGLHVPSARSAGLAAGSDRRAP
jgi:hypothetical protein